MGTFKIRCFPYLYLPDMAPVLMFVCWTSKGKSQFVPVSAVKAYKSSSGIRVALLILSHSTKWRWAVSITPLPLYPRRKSPRCAFNRKLGVPQNMSGSFGKKYKSLFPFANQTPDRPVRSLVTVHTKLVENSTKKKIYIEGSISLRTNIR
jgi:hypothetical protein